MAAEAAVGIGIAAAAINFYKFSISLAKTVRQIHNALDGLPEDLEECVRSLNAFERLVARLDRSLQSTDASGPMTEAESDLKYFIDVCRKAGEELDALLKGVLPDPSRACRRWRDDVKAGLRLLRKRGAFERVIQKVQGYKSELGLLLLERSVTQRATNTASALAHVLDNEERNAQTQRLLLDRLGANEAALGDLVQMFSEARNDFAERQLRNDMALDTLQTILRMANEQQLSPRPIYISLPQFDISPAAWWYQFCHQIGLRIATATQTLRGVSKLRLQQLVPFKHGSDIRPIVKASRPRQLLLVALKGHHRVEQLNLGGSESDVEFAELLRSYSRSHATWLEWVTLQRPARVYFVKYSKKCVNDSAEFERLPIEAKHGCSETSSPMVCESAHPEVIFQLGSSSLVDSLLADDSTLPGFHSSNPQVRLTPSARKAGRAGSARAPANGSPLDHTPLENSIGSTFQAQDSARELRSVVHERQLLDMMSSDPYHYLRDPDTQGEACYSASEDVCLVPEFRALLHGLEEYEFDEGTENHPDRHRLSRERLHHTEEFAVCVRYDKYYPEQPRNIVPYLETLNTNTSIHHITDVPSKTEQWGIEIETGFDWGLFWWLVLLVVALLLQYLIHTWKQCTPWLVATFRPLTLSCKAQGSSNGNSSALPKSLQQALRQSTLPIIMSLHSAIQHLAWYISTHLTWYASKIFWWVIIPAVPFVLRYLNSIRRRFNSHYTITPNPGTLRWKARMTDDIICGYSNARRRHIRMTECREPGPDVLAAVKLVNWCLWVLSPILGLITKFSDAGAVRPTNFWQMTWTWRTRQEILSTLRAAATFENLLFCIGDYVGFVFGYVSIHARAVTRVLRAIYQGLPYVLGIVVFIQAYAFTTKLMEDTLGQLTPLCLLQILGLGCIPHLRIVVRMAIFGASFFSLRNTTDGPHLHLGWFVLTVLLLGASVASFRW